MVLVTINGCNCPSENIPTRWKIPYLVRFGAENGVTTQNKIFVDAFQE